MPGSTNVTPPTSTMHVGLLVQDYPLTHDIHAYLRSAEGSPSAGRVPEIPISNLSPHTGYPDRSASCFTQAIEYNYGTLRQSRQAPTDELLTSYWTGLHSLTQKAKCGIEPKDETAKWIYTDLIQNVLIRAKFQVLTAVLLELTVFWGVTPCLHIPDSTRHSQCTVWLLTATAAPF